MPQAAPRSTARLICTLALLTAACHPNMEKELPPAPPDPGVALEESGLRRLTHDQVSTSLTVLLGLTPEAEREPDLVRGGFASVGASEVITSSRGAEQHAIAVDLAVKEAFAAASPGTLLLPCEDAPAHDAACTDAFLSTFGRLAWRRPLDADERSRYRALAASVAVETRSQHQALTSVGSALLQSPWFLYRVEVAKDGGFTDYAMASRMAFLLWGGPPDNLLLDAAQAGALDTMEGVRAEAARMLDDPRASDGIVAFVRELYQLRRIDDITRDFVELFGEDELFDLGQQGDLVAATDGIKRSMREEVEQTYRHALRTDGDLLELLVSDRTMVNATMEELYDVRPDDETGPHTWSEAKRRGNTKRTGILGTMGLLSLYNKQNATSPTLRGKFVSETFLCREIPPPPPGVATGFTPPDDVSRREALGIHAQNPTCAACHAGMDPLGFALDSFDAIGMERNQDDWGYRLDLTGDLDGDNFRGLPDLAWLLRDHPDTEACFTRHVFRYAFGRVDGVADASLLTFLHGTFASRRFEWREMMLAFVTSSAFRGAPGDAQAMPPAVAPEDLSTIASDLFGASCAPCHTVSADAGLSLALDADLAARLASASVQIPSMPLVAPGDPDGSYLLRKVEDSHLAAGGAGSAMPPSTSLSAEQTGRLRAWILDGAR